MVGTTVIYMLNRRRMAVRKIGHNRKEDIMRAARLVFRKQGFEAARMSDIAERAGIAKGTVYLYFTSKLSILEALVDSYYDLMVDAISPSLTNPDSALAIREAVHAAFDLAARERDLVVLLDLRFGLTRKKEAIGNPVGVKIIRRFLKDCHSRGRLRHHDIAPAAVLTGGLIQWITKYCLVWQKDDDLSRYEETAVHMLQYALLDGYKA